MKRTFTAASRVGNGLTAEQGRMLVRLADENRPMYVVKESRGWATQRSYQIAGLMTVLGAKGMLTTLPTNDPLVRRWVPSYQGMRWIKAAPDREANLPGAMW